MQRALEEISRARDIAMPYEITTRPTRRLFVSVHWNPALRSSIQR